MNRNAWANVPPDKLPAHVCPACYMECPVDGMPHAGCPPFGRVSEVRRATRRA